MEALTNTALDAEPPKRDLPVYAGNRVSVIDQAAVSIDICVLRLQHIKVIWRADSETYIALKVAGLIVVSLFARAVLRKVLGSSHDKLSLVTSLCHLLRANRLVEIAVHG